MISNDQSFSFFLQDIWTRSLDCREWIYAWDDNVPAEFSPRQELAIRQLFERIQDYLLHKVKIRGRESMVSAVQTVHFHPRFGWSLAGEAGRACLGKTSLPGGAEMEIGAGSYFSGSSTLRGEHPFYIGRFTSVAEGLYANSTPDMHPMAYPAMINFATERRCLEEGYHMEVHPEMGSGASKGIVIGHDVWIGRDVRLFHGVQIADGCVIAERSLLRGFTEPYGIYAGVPAKLKKFRFSDEIISQLLTLKWWNWPKEKILRNHRFFSTDLTKYQGRITDLLET